MHLGELSAFAFSLTHSFTLSVSPFADWLPSITRKWDFLEVPDIRMISALIGNCQSRRRKENSGPLPRRRRGLSQCQCCPHETVDTLGKNVKWEREGETDRERAGGGGEHSRPHSQRPIGIVLTQAMFFSK